VVADDRPVCGSLSELGPLTIEQVRRTPQEALFNGLVEQFHYLGYEQPVGEHLKYLVSAKGQVIACLAWSSSPRRPGCRDRFIGWGMEARRRNIHLLAYNTRFLILPWVTVPHLASHILGRMAGRFRATGSGSMHIRSICWKRSSIRNGSAGPAGPAIARPIG
jgi:hypothetical protein